MFGFYPGQHVIVKINNEEVEGVIIRQFIASSYFLVELKDKTQTHIERKDIKPIK